MSLSLGRFSNYSSMFVLAAAICVGGGAAFFLAAAANDYRQESSRLVARNAALRVADLIRQEKQTLQQVAQQSDLAALMAPEKSAEREARADRITAYIPQAMKTRLLSPGKHALDESSLPYFGYACIEMLTHAEQGRPVPEAELHLSDTESAHIDMLQAIRAPGDNRLLGHLVLSINPALLQNALARDDARQDYLELRQYISDNEFTVLAKSGDAALQSAVSPEIQAIDNTGWKIAVWSTGHAWRPDARQIIVLALFLLAALLLAILGPQLVRRNMTRALYRDADTFMAMIRDIRLAAPKDRYPIQLDDLRPLVDSLLKSGGELLADQSIMEEIRKSDQLTGLATRRAFDLRLSQLFEQNKMGYASTVFLIDISQMGLLNNKYGQETGDGIIRDFATAISTILRESDFIARIGGDKFGVILPFTDLATSKKLADRLRMQLTTEIGKLGPNKIIPNWRGGMASMQPTDQSPKSVFQRAENVLLSAKHGGDNLTLS